MGLAKLIMEFCLESDGKYGFRRDYSGRMMFGRECVGIVCDDVLEMMVSFVGYLSEKGEHSSIKNTCQDNMGKGYIVYFPDVVWKGDDIASALGKFCKESDGKYVFHKEYSPSGMEESFVGIACDGMADLLMGITEFMEVNRIYDVDCELADPEAEESGDGYVVYFPHIKKRG